MTTKQLANACQVTEKAVAPRMTELCAMGDARDSGGRHTSLSGRGRKQVVWEIALKRSPHMPPDEYDECGEHLSCGRCGGDGVIHLSEAGPSIWGEDCFCEEDRLIQCPTCRGKGVEN